MGSRAPHGASNHPENRIKMNTGRTHPTYMSRVTIYIYESRTGTRADSTQFGDETPGARSKDIVDKDIIDKDIVDKDIVDKP
ncbi:hypothetical protein BaRGS_00021720 [Batillaria attramentaria]|uniref:Uncharacterized protein n=1 Tax=Batillaria attramentaria TaxID=370345 RepID=A0ABD0KIN9_9CAEN